MKFGDTALGDAVGAILAHSLRMGVIAFKKGRILSADDIAVLGRSGHKSVMAAIIEDGDIGEDDAAARIATAAAGAHVRTSAPFTGRCNLFAEQPGIVQFNTKHIHHLNSIDESITIATVPNGTAVAEGDMLATIKIIPFAVPESQVRQAEEIAVGKGHSLMHLALLRPVIAGLIVSENAGLKNSVIKKTIEVSRARIEGLGGTLPENKVIRCTHSSSEIANGIGELLAAGAELVMISGASAIVDRRDVIPSAIVDAGGEIIHFGMPVDPGNLMLLARHGDVPVLGLPGCARSPKPNGIDVMLQLLSANLPLGAEEIMRMGAGGLLKDVSARPYPRSEPAVELTDNPAGPARAPRIAAIILAAGQSRRMGDINKLLATVAGEPMISRVTNAVLGSSANPVIVVTGHQSGRVAAALADKDVQFVENPDYPEGLSSSLRTGLMALTALPDDIDGVLVCLGDMPDVTACHLDKLVAAFDPVEGREICVATFGGKRGNPVLWGRRFFEEMRSVSGDVGARHLIGEHAELVREVAFDDDGVLIDLDTPEVLESYRAEQGQAG